MADLEEQLSDEEKVGAGGCAAPRRAALSSPGPLSREAAGTSSALALWFVFLPSPRGRACQSGGREEGRRGGRGKGWPGRRAVPGASPAAPCRVRARRGAGPGVRRRRRPLCRLLAAAGAAGTAAACRRLRPVRGGAEGGRDGMDGRERQKRRGGRRHTRLSLPLPFPHLRFPFPRRLAGASRLLHSTGAALPTQGLRSEGPALAIAAPCSPGRRWGAGGFGEEGRVWG